MEGLLGMEGLLSMEGLCGVVRLLVVEGGTMGCGVCMMCEECVCV